MATVRIVIWDARGQAWQRCEDHIPQGVRDYIDYKELPGWIAKIWTVDVQERTDRCFTCLAESLRPTNNKPAADWKPGKPVY